MTQRTCSERSGTKSGAGSPSIGRERLATFHGFARSPLARDWTIAGTGIALAVLLGETASILVGLALFAAGLPHGFIRGTSRNPRLSSPFYWAGYVVAGALTFAAFLVTPLVALAAFLALSLWHFAMSDALGSRSANAAIAGLAVGGSALFRPDATGAMLGYVAGRPLPEAILDVLAVPGAAGAIMALALIARKPGEHWPLSLAIAVVAGVHPVLAVGAIFYLYHAARIQARLEAARSTWIFPLILVGALSFALAGSQTLAAISSPGPAMIAIASAAAIAIIVPHLIEDLIDRGTAGFG